MSHAKVALYGDIEPRDAKGNQRLPVERLKAWQALEYGMFIHFGLASFSQNLGNLTIDLYNPTDLDTDQWARTARDAGMKYIIFTTQHGNSMCMWRTKLEGVTHVGQSKVPRDVVASFVESCKKYDIKPAFYYSWSPLSGRPGQWISGPDGFENYCTREQVDFVKAQLEELLTRYGPVEEIWIDGPVKYGPAGRHEIYRHCNRLQPDMLVAMNSWGVNRYRFPEIHHSAWPCDILVLEVLDPPYAQRGGWLRLDITLDGQKANKLDYYLPVECCNLIHRSGVDWFFDPNSQIISDKELLGMRLLCSARRANLVLNVAPGPTGQIPKEQVDALMRLQENFTRFCA